MSKRLIVSSIDEILEKHQFRRSGDLWNRDYADFIDVIDLQVGKTGETFAVNIGVAEKFVLKTCWGWDGSSGVEEASCTVRVRLGALLHGRDIWWPLSGRIDEVVNGVESAALPFLAKNHNVDELIGSLESDPSATRYPPEAIYLALLYCRRNERELCLNMLKRLEAKFAGSWHQKVSQILSSLN